jgi:MFS family permease|tara:strand:+ start:762 stop:1952 length:1191 start_codon:yes stop_codon:yes gene_type:complete
LFNFIHKNFNLLFFGFLIAFSSGFGQTFFISLFSNDFRATFNLSNTEFGSIYSIATVLSAITIIWAGKLIDTVNLKKYTLTIVFGMAIACLMASLAFNIFFLFLTIYFLRLFGQGLMGHTSRTTIARYFNTNRGKALAISGFGFYIGEMFYPIIIVFLILTIGWRLTWFSSSIFVFVILGLSFYFLLRNNNFKIEKNLNNNTEFQQVSWRRRDVLKDTKFYIYLPLSLLMSFTVTGFLFHQVFIADIKSWTMMNLAQSFIFFAVSGLIGSIFSGLLVDKFTGRKLIPFHLIPMALILVSLLFSNHVYILYLYMAGLGFSNGFTENISNSLWAEMYGVNNLGSIKALLTFFGVLASASSPFLYGILLDQTNSINILVYLSLTLILIFSMMAYIGKKF